MSITKKIQEIESAIDLLKIKAIALKEELSGGSDSSLKKSGLSKQQLSQLVQKRRKNISNK